MLIVNPRPNPEHLFTFPNLFSGSPFFIVDKEYLIVHKNTFLGVYNVCEC